MKVRLSGSMVIAAAALTAASLVTLSAAGQAPASRANLPRLPDGHPNLQGLWVADAVGAAHSVEDGRDPSSDTIQDREGERNPTVLVEPADGRLPYQGWAAEIRRQLLVGIFTPTSWEHVDPHVRALLDGVPRINYVPGGFQIGQRPDHVAILYESNHTWRSIPVDGRPHVGKGIKLWMGDSRGRWEGDTLVVDVTNFNEGNWFDSHGSFHSDALHVVERWTMVSPNRIDYEATVEDPKVFTGPWKLALRVDRRTDKAYEQWEDSRHEGERDAEGILRGGRREKEAGIVGIHEHRRPK